MKVNEVLHKFNVMSIVNPNLRCYLTGSRYFGGATINSDWDYMCVYNNSMGMWKKLGFTIVESPDYNSDELSAVVEMLCDDGKVQVQLIPINLMEKKLSAQAKMASNKEFINSLTKDQRKSLWKMMTN